MTKKRTQYHLIADLIENEKVIVGDYAITKDKDFTSKIHNLDVTEDTLTIGKFTVLEEDVTIVMDDGRLNPKAVSSYPFELIDDSYQDSKTFKGETVIGNDVHIGRGVIIMPGVFIGDGAVIKDYSVVFEDIAAYMIAEGNPAKMMYSRFSKDFRMYLLKLKWWNWEKEKIIKHIDALTSNDLEAIKSIAKEND